MTLAESVTNWSFIPVLDDMTPDQLIFVELASMGFLDSDAHFDAHTGTDAD